MDGAGTTIFDRIEQKISASGVTVDIADLKDASSQYDLRIADNPADLDAKMVSLELKVVMLARLLNAVVDVLPQGGASIPAEHAVANDSPAEAAVEHPHVPGNKKKRLRQNPATGIIEEIEDTAEDNVIVADTRARYRGPGAEHHKEDKKCVFIAATDDETVPPKKK